MFEHISEEDISPLLKSLTMEILKPLELWTSWEITHTKHNTELRIYNIHDEPEKPTGISESLKDKINKLVALIGVQDTHHMEIYYGCDHIDVTVRQIMPDRIKSDGTWVYDVKAVVFDTVETDDGDMVLMDMFIYAGEEYAKGNDDPTQVVVKNNLTDM